MHSAKTAKRSQNYDRIAKVYDLVDLFIPAAWRRKAAGLACGRVLEAGIGTGLNLPFYSSCCTEIFGIDISQGMLSRAEGRASLCQAPVTLELMDVQNLSSLAAGSFDYVVATFLFCSVLDPLKGLRECRRVLKPGGRLVLLEHMGSETMLLRQLMDWLNPLTVKLLGDHINRNTVRLAGEAGFKVQTVENLLGDIVRLVVAEP